MLIGSSASVASMVSMLLAFPAQESVDMMQRQCKVQALSTHMGYQWSEAQIQKERTRSGLINVTLSANWNTGVRKSGLKKPPSLQKVYQCAFALDEKGQWVLVW